MKACLALLLMLLVAFPATAQSPSGLPAATPMEPVSALIDALRTQGIVAITDPHGNEQVQDFLLALVRDARFPVAANDIVLEALSARYQDVLDRYVRGDAISEAAIRRAWEEHTVPNSLGVQVSELVRAIRAVNLSLPTTEKIRVLAGDPPIDWDHIVTSQDHRRWIELRDSYPADIIRRQVLDRGRRALVVYGQGHLQRGMIEANYETTPWQAQTVISLLERDPAVRVFTVFTWLRGADFLADTVAAWRSPSLAHLKGTNLGARDFAEYHQPLGGQRVGLDDGKTVAIPKEQWTLRPMEQQFDALLYVGMPAALTTAPVPQSLCQDAAFMQHRLDRLTRFGPRVEVERLKKACGIQ
jgi:hypothetical protein